MGRVLSSARNKVERAGKLGSVVQWLRLWVIENKIICMHEFTLSTGLLFANGVWDFISALSICFFISYRWCAAVANMHLGLWVNVEDRVNEKVAAVMVILLIQWGFIRFHGSLVGPVSEATCVDASFTYMLEAALVLVEVVAGNMHQTLGWFTVVACVVCWMIIMSECSEIH